MTFASHIVFTWAPVNFMWAQAQVRLGVATSLSLDDTPRAQLVVTPEVHDVHVVGDTCASVGGTVIRVSIVLFYHLTKAIAEGPMQLSLPRVLASMAHRL